MCVALSGAASADAAQTSQPGRHAARVLAALVEHAAHLDGHRKGVAVVRTDRDGLKTLTAWYVARPGAYADSGAYRLREVKQGQMLIAVSVAKFAQARRYAAGERPENEAAFELTFKRVKVRNRLHWKLREQDESRSCGYHRAPPDAGEYCPGIAGEREILDLAPQEAAEYEQQAKALIAAARRHAPV